MNSLTHLVFFILSMLLMFSGHASAAEGEQEKSKTAIVHASVMDWQTKRRWVARINGHEVIEKNIVEEALPEDAAKTRRDLYQEQQRQQAAFVEEMRKAVREDPQPPPFGRVLKFIDRHAPNANDLFISADGRKAVFVHLFEPVLIDLDKRQLAPLMVGDCDNEGVAAWSADGKRVAISVNNHKEVAVYDLNEKKEIHHFPGDKFIAALLWSADGKHLFQLRFTSVTRKDLTGVFRALASHPVFLHTFCVSTSEATGENKQEVTIVSGVGGNLSVTLRASE